MNLYTIERLKYKSENYDGKIKFLSRLPIKLKETKCIDNIGLLITIL